MSSIILIVALIIGAIFLIKFLVKYKVPKTNCLTMVTGGVKSGKSTLSVYLAISNYKRRLFSWRVKCFFCKMFNKKIPEKPLLYSNVPLKCDYVQVSNDILTRRVRIAYGSVVYIQEASLVCDSMLIKDKDLNLQLLLFNKLFGHESKGGLLVYDTQCIADVHYSVKRSLANYFYIHHCEKRIPFFIVLKVRELMYSDDGSVINNVDNDLEDSLKTVIIPKSVWKKFDCYCYSTLTDTLPIATKIINGKYLNDLKSKQVISFRPDLQVDMTNALERRKKFLMEGRLENENKKDL